MKYFPIAIILIIAGLCNHLPAYAQFTETATADTPSANSGLSDIARVKDYLQITPDQENAWNYFVDKVDGYANQMFVQHQSGTTKPDSAPRKIGRMVDVMQNRLAALEQVEGASKSLYALLSDAQKKRADDKLVSAIPVFASSSNLSCPVSDTPKCREERTDTPRKRRGAGALGGGANMN